MTPFSQRLKANASTVYTFASFFTIVILSATQNQLQAKSITVTSVTPNSICFSTSATSGISIPYTTTGSFSSNTFTAQLSDASGGFATPTDIGSLVSDVAGTINATIPANTPAGTGYLIRIVSSNPVLTSTDSVAFTI